MFRGWVKNHAPAPTQSIDCHTEIQNMEEASRAALHIMSDDLEGAEVGLSSGTSSYHKLGKGMVAFLRATLGFEQEIMRQAAERLAEAESSANSDYRHAQRSSHVFRSSIYPPGTEYSLCYAETQLMTAVVGVLNESLTESIKGFYKLRKAYQTLDGILASEAKYMTKRRGFGVGKAARGSTESFRSNMSARSAKDMPGGLASGWSSAESSRPPSRQSLENRHMNHRAMPPSGLSRIDTGIPMGEEDDEDEFFDVDEVYDHVEHDTYMGKIDIDATTQNLNGLSIKNDEHEVPPPEKPPPYEHGMMDHDPDSDIFSDPIDVFIHSGANLCFGMLNVMISMIPPAFSKLLVIIGFHGDKERGIRMLWQASKFHNINGAMAGLIVLGYYNTFVGFSDIVPESDHTVPEDEQVEGYPKQRCEALLAEMRHRHPNSHLWLLEEARMNAFNKRLSTAIQIIEKSPPSKLKQVEAIEMFEKSLDAMYSHRYELCSTSFIACLTLNNWSPTLYNYIAGCAQLELYRLTKLTNPAAAKKHATKATDLLKEAPQHAGKKKFMARQLPFDVFVTRKVRKWEALAHDLGCSFIEAAGVSPIEEMIFFWSGYKRMDTFHLEESLERLAWSDERSDWQHEGHDERAILGVLRAATLRSLGRLDEAEKVLQRDVLSVDKAELKGGLKDDWTAPAAHYEMGVICWNRRAEAARQGLGGEHEERWVKECESWVEKAAKWESYELDARVGMKIATAQDTLQRWREKHRRVGNQ